MSPVNSAGLLQCVTRVGQVLGKQPVQMLGLPENLHES